jgi:hypothetical protein
MLKVHYRLLVLLIILTVPLIAPAQFSVLRLQPYTGPGTFINQQFSADSAANNGIPANRVYELRRGSLYLANLGYRVNAGATMRLRANDSTGNKPVIFLYPTGNPPNPQNPPGNFLDLRGNLEMSNIVLSGYFEAIDTNLNNLQGGLINIPTAGAGASIRIDSCIISNSNGNHIRTDGATRVIRVTNSIFANMGYLGRSNLGAGKAIDLRDASSDTVIFQNCSFINWQDRVIRHYNFSNPQAGTGPLRYLLFDHNTLANGMSYHGLLSLGSMGPRAIISNNLLIDPFSLGNDSDATRQAEFVNNLEHDSFGGARMTWIFTTPNDTTQWTIRKNYYVVSPEGQAFWDSASVLPIVANPALTAGSPLTYNINARLGADSLAAFTKISLTLNEIPALMVKTNKWYRSPTGGNKTKNTPSAAWNKSFDFDRRGWQYFHDTLDCAYSTGSPAYTAADGGYPVGDLNWFPVRYAAWLNDPVNAVPGDDGQPVAFALDQNYPNPFNPATTITFTIGKSGFTTLVVYNILGQKVATPVAGMLSAGTHEVRFNASALASGMYFYQLASGSSVAVKKMMVLK